MRDVRMKGFAERADVEEVQTFLAEVVARLGAEPVDLLACVSRVLAEEVISEFDVPGFARAAMDGYAIRGEDSFGASSYDPLHLDLIGESLPGRPFLGRVEAGQAVRIMTGAAMPEGADAVVMAEVCEELDHVVELCDAVAPRKNVGAIGEDIRAGALVLEADRRLRPQDAGLLASIAVCSVACVRRPRVQLLITGDELLPPGSRPEGARIADSNSALVERDAGEVLPYTILPDRAEVIRAALDDSVADVLLVSGGSSVGQEDHAPRLVAELGRLDFHGIAMRPSSPTGIGRLPGGEGDRFVFLLPGNPVSCLCAYEFFAGPTIRALGGRPVEWPHRRVHLPLARKISSAIGRVDYVRVAVEQGMVFPIAISGASILSSTVRAAGAVIVSRGCEGMPEGEEVEVLLYDEVTP
jgi:molybdopterin molybdotransferase